MASAAAAAVGAPRRVVILGGGIMVLSLPASTRANPGTSAAIGIQFIIGMYPVHCQRPHTPAHALLTMPTARHGVP